jgi:16S rRNA C1402 (ribose-2'-O) methylase RsmI
VIVPPGVLTPPESVALIDEAGIAVPLISAPGPDTVVVVLAVPTTVEVIPEPHVLVVCVLFWSPL